MEKIKAVIFDWGGVLVDDLDSGLIRYCADALGVSKEDCTAVHKKFRDDFQKGLLTEDQFWNKMCVSLKVAKPNVPSLWTEAFKAVYSPKQDMLSLARTLQQTGCKTAVLSDTEPPGMDFFLKQNYDMFDVIVFSCAEKTKKPETKIYEIALQRLETSPDQSVFIDNRQKFTEAAEKLGINTILFETPRQVKNELTQLGVKTD